MKKSIFLFFAAILCAMTANAQWYLMGTVTDWSSGKQMTGDSKVVSVTVNLQANETLELKIKNGNSWYGNGGTMSSTNNLAWGFSTSDGSNAKIETTDAGDYTFTWYISDKKLSVTYPNHNYIVAGDGAVMEDEWSPSSAKNKMSKQDDGTYRLTKTNRNLEAKTYKYKLTVGSWDVNQYPDKDVELKVSPAGNYNVVFTYNPKNGQLSHELVPVYTITASANPATAGTITGAGTYAKDASVTLEATPNAGYKFINWTVGGVEKSTDAKYSFTASADVTAIANFELSDPEVPTYAISVSANDDAMGTVTGAGDYTEGSPVTLTATPKAGYRFVNWTVGGAEVSTANPYTFIVNEDVTLVANFEELPEETVYFINAGKWSKVHLHLWKGNAVGTEWPGTQLTATGEKIGEYDVYSYTAKQGNHLNLLFHENTGDVNKTTDLTWSDGVDKYYIHNYNSNTGWYTKAEAEELLVVPVVYETVYFVNNKNWSLVQIHAWKDAANNGWPGQALTATGEKVEGFDVYSFEAAQGTYTNLIFNNKEGDAGVQSANYVWTADKYYYMGAAENYAGGTKEEVATLVAPDPLATDVYLVGQMNGWSTTANEFKKDAEDATIASLTLTLEEKTTYEFKVMREGDWISCKDNLDIKETVSGLQFSSSVGDNCKLTTTVKGDYVFTWEMSTFTLSITYPASTPTALDNLNTTVAPVKMIENGQLIIIKNGVQYNAQGAILK